MTKTLRERAYDVAMAAIGPASKLIERTSLVPTTPFLRPQDFQWTYDLERGWRDIRHELENVLTWRNDLPAFHEINADATDIRNDAWKSFFLYGWGARSEDNCRRCPRTAALVEQIPGMKTALFSILAPGIRVPPHRGAWKGVMRYHLGVMVPDPVEGCGIVVGGQKAHWREGESMLFDDTYEHHVWNETNGTRVVLFLDVVRPCRFPGSLVNQAVINGAALTPFIKSSIQRHREWEKRFAAKHGKIALESGA